MPVILEGPKPHPQVNLPRVLVPRNPKNGRNHHQRRCKLPVSRRVHRKVPHTGTTAPNDAGSGYEGVHL